MAVEESTNQAWGDQDDEDNDSTGGSNVLPDNYETDVNDDGIKHMISFFHNDAGKVVKVTRSVRVHKKTVKMSRAVLARRKWAKFGVCANEAQGYHGVGWKGTLGETYSDISEQRLDLVAKEKTREESNTALDNAFQQQVSILGAWKPSWQRGESKAPSTGPPTQEWAKSGADAMEASREGGGEGGGSSLAALAAGDGGASGRYVPPSHRGADGMRMDRGMERDENATVRVSNLSEDVTDVDLRELFRRFGHIQRVYLAKDRETFTSRGFAFINFHHREDAAESIKRLNGHGYDHLILSVDWANPSAK